MNPTRHGNILRVWKVQGVAVEWYHQTLGLNPFMAVILEKVISVSDSQCSYL